ncbi:MAG: hypothetical protein QOF15_362, partial [Mycobacterium sp.]|nr:hypothetical protein [Mycobacterium sp.]
MVDSNSAQDDARDDHRSLSSHTSDNPDWGSREIELLHHAVLDEMRAINAFAELGVADDSLQELANAVTIRIDYAFAIKWSPDWVPLGRPHTWRDEHGWHARCNSCLAESSASSSEHQVVV